MTGPGDLRTELLEREKARRDALVNDDRAGLAELLADDLVHVHTTGQIHGKAQLLDHATGFLRFIEVRRGRLEIRALGPDAAVMLGTMTNTVQRRGSDELHEIQSFVTQVWVKEQAGWLLSCFHAVRTAEPSEKAKS